MQNPLTKSNIILTLRNVIHNIKKNSINASGKSLGEGALEVPLTRIVLSHHVSLLAFPLISIFITMKEFEWWCTTNSNLYFSGLECWREFQIQFSLMSVLVESNTGKTN